MHPTVPRSWAGKETDLFFCADKPRVWGGCGPELSGRILLWRSWLAAFVRLVKLGVGAGVFESRDDKGVFLSFVFVYVTGKIRKDEVISHARWFHITVHELWAARFCLSVVTGQRVRDPACDRIGLQSKVRCGGESGRDPEPHSLLKR